MTKVIRSNGHSKKVKHRFEHDELSWGQVPEWMEEARKFDGRTMGPPIKPSAQSSVQKKK